MRGRGSLTSVLKALLFSFRANKKSNGRMMCEDWGEILNDQKNKTG